MSDKNKKLNISIKEHISSYFPEKSYCNRFKDDEIRYLTSILTITYIYEDFLIKYLLQNCPYITYY